MFYNRRMSDATRRKVYLDVCCLNRPLDDQTRERIRRESAAVMRILGRFARGEWQWLGSEIVDFETARIDSAPRRHRIATLGSVSK